MSRHVIPHNEWEKFLEAFSSRHAGGLVSIETHDLKTGETVTSRFVQFESAELDLEDRKNPRINVTVRDDLKEIKHILFRPSNVLPHVSESAKEDGLRIVSVNTVTTLRFAA